MSEVPRTADIIATEDVEALILTREILTRAMEGMPNIMVKVLFNLSMTLPERLLNTVALQGGGDLRPHLDEFCGATNDLSYRISGTRFPH